MRDYRGIPFHQIDDARVRDQLATIDEYLRQTSFGFANIDAGHSSSGGGQPSLPVNAHTLLNSAIHTDTLTAAPTRGGLIVGNSTPAWSALTVGAASTWLGSDGTDAAWNAAAALAKVDDTNVTLTLTGTPLTALLRATTMTLGWSGQLSIARGGTGQSTATAAFDALAPTTTAGDTIYHNGTDNIRLAIAADNTFYVSTGTAPEWRTILSTDIPDLSTTYQPRDPDLDQIAAVVNVAGDILYTDSTPEWVRLGIGASATVLQVNGSATPAWAALSGDATLAVGGALTLASTAVTPGTYGDSTHVGQFTVDAKGRLTFAADVAIGGAAPAPHALLSVDHSDTVANAVSRGSLIYGNATPAWDELVIGTTGKFLRSDGTDASWQLLVAGDIPDLSATYQPLDPDLTQIAAVANVRGDLLVTDATPAWIRLGIGATTRFLQSDGTDPSWVVLSGDATAAAGGALTLANTTVTPGSYGSATEVGTFTVDSKGRLTAAANVTITATPTAHALLGAAHSDTVAQTVSRGSLIYGNSTPAWDELTIGTVGKFLRSDGTDASWQLLVAGDIPDLSATYQPLDPDLTQIAAVANVRGDLLVTDSGPTWVRLAIGTANQILGVHATLADPEYKSIVGTASEIDVTHGAGTITIGLIDPLIVGKGGSGAATLTGVLIGNATSAFTATTSSTVGQVLRVTGANTYAFGALDLDDTDAITGTLDVPNGGTNIASYAVGDILYASAATVLSKLADVAAGSYLRSGGVTTAPVWSTTTLPNAATTGDVLYASASNVYSNLAGVATGNALISGGVATAPSWGKIGLTTHVSGTLGVANGGTGAATLTGLLQGNGTAAFTVVTDSSTVGQVLRVTGAATYAWGALDLDDADAVTGTLGVANGGTNLASGTSGGILGFTGSTTLASSVLLTANALLLGGGVGATPVPMASLGTTIQVLHGNAAGAPTFAAVSLTADVSGDLPFANLAQGSALSVLGVTGNAIADVASIVAANDHEVLRRSGTAVAFGAVNLAQSAAVTGVLAIANGGSNKALTLSAGGILWTDADSFEVLAGTATAGQILRSGASVTPSWSTATYPATAGSSGNVLTSDGTNWTSAAPAGGTVDTARTWTTLQKFPDDMFNIVGSATATKILRFEVDGLSGTTTLIPQNYSSYAIAGSNIANIFDKLQTIIPDSDVVSLLIGAFPGGGVSDIFQVIDDSAAELFTIGISGNITSNGVNTLGLVQVNGAGTATRFVDSTTSSKSVFVDISGAGASTTTTLDFNQTSGRTITFPDATTTLVGTDVTQTLTNKTLGDGTDDVSAVIIKTCLLTGSGGNQMIEFDDNLTAFVGRFLAPAAGLGADRAWILPDASGTMIMAGTGASSGRVGVFSGSAGALTLAGDADMTFATDTLTVTKIVCPSINAGYPLNDTNVVVDSNGNVVTGGGTIIYV